jgi:cytidylate kinase
MKILICGAHGAAKGADTLAGEIAEEYGLKVIKFPARWDLYGRAAGPIRNTKMLREGKPKIIYAFYTDKNESKGTKDMVRQGRKAGIKVVENK